MLSFSDSISYFAGGLRLHPKTGMNKKWYNSHMFEKLHAKVGDLWWYSAMIFIACRSGDVIQAFIGLWLVPKYVSQEELGAVLPLQQLSGLFAVPLAIIAIVFSKFVNTYATHGEYGKVKCFIRDVLITATLVFIICIIVAYIVIPHFYERMRITAGSLTVLILAVGFTANISQLFTNALQGLKQFKAITVINLIAAPIRLITMLIAMPFRALSGYILGQATPPVSTSIVAAIALHKQLHDTPMDTSWRRDISSIIRYLWPVAIYTAFTTLFATISATVYRQRLPEIESAAYYLLSRFAEIAGYLGLSMVVVLFPIAAEAHEKRKENATPLIHTMIATGVTSIGLAIFFAFMSPMIFSIVDTWRAYLPYVHLLPWITLVIGCSTIIGAIVSYEMACQRFTAPFFILLFSFIITIVLVSLTGWEFYRGLLPDKIVDWMSEHNLANLTRLTWFSIISGAIQVSVLLFLFRTRLKLQHHNTPEQ